MGRTEDALNKAAEERERRRIEENNLPQSKAAQLEASIAKKPEQDSPPPSHGKTQQTLRQAEEEREKLRQHGSTTKGKWRLVITKTEDIEPLLFTPWYRKGVVELATILELAETRFVKDSEKSGVVQIRCVVVLRSADRYSLYAIKREKFSHSNSLGLSVILSASGGTDPSASAPERWEAINPLRIMTTKLRDNAKYFMVDPTLWAASVRRMTDGADQDRDYIFLIYNAHCVDAVGISAVQEIRISEEDRLLTRPFDRARLKAIPAVNTIDTLVARTVGVGAMFRSHSISDPRGRSGSEHTQLRPQHMGLEHQMHRKLVSIPAHTRQMLSEASVCFTTGNLRAAILLLAMAIETDLRLRIDAAAGNAMLGALINDVKKAGKLTGVEEAIAQDVRQARNRAAHAKVFQPTEQEVHDLLLEVQRFFSVGKRRRTS